MAFRLQELLRQRAIVQEHLKWLDAEIASLSAGPKPDELPSIASTLSLLQDGVPPSRLVAPPKETVPIVADEILAEYQNDPKNLRENVRRGLLLYFGLALTFVAGVIALIHFGYSHRQ